MRRSPILGVHTRELTRERIYTFFRQINTFRVEIFDKSSFIDENPCSCQLRSFLLACESSILVPRDLTLLGNVSAAKSR